MQRKIQTNILNGPRVGVILGASVFAYFASIVARSSMGVASLAATNRFDIGAAALSSLAVAQLIVYAAMQVPVGLALEKFGSRRLIIFGGIVTGLGNGLVAFAPYLPMAIAGRMLVGFGDAFVFISMIRLLNSWVKGPRATRYTQLFANIGQLGQIASAIPFAYILGVYGWTPAFSGVAALTLISAGICMFSLKDGPDQLESRTQPKPAREILKQSLADPFTRKAFWVHFTLQSSGSLFILLWGYPFLVQGEGLTKVTASLLLGSFVFIGFLVGPILSYFCVTFPERRNRLVTVMYSIILIAWLLILLTPGPSPFFEIVLLVLAVGSGGPASMIAFDYSRTSVPKSRLGTSNGVINSGGFIATFLCMFLVGGALDLIHSTKVIGDHDLYSLGAFKLAFPVQLIVISFGLAMFYRERRLTREVRE